MSDPVFMSAEHVAAMNAVLAADGTVRAACAALAKQVTIAYELSDGPGGTTVYWSIAFAETVRFGLEPTAADLVLRGDWARMVHAAKANRQGQVEDPAVLPVGDVTVMQAVAPVFALASNVATLPVVFPETEECR